MGILVGAIAANVPGGLLPEGLAGTVGVYALPLAAFGGGWASIMVLIAILTRHGPTSVEVMRHRARGADR